MSTLELWQALAIVTGLGFALVSLWNVHLRNKLDALSREIEIAYADEKRGTTKSNHQEVLLNNATTNPAHSAKSDKPSKRVKAH